MAPKSSELTLLVCLFLISTSIFGPLSMIHVAGDTPPGIITGSNSTHGLGWIPNETAKIPASGRRMYVGSPPSSVDWRNMNGYNWITPIKNQLSCGSCVAFGSVATLEAAIKITDQNPTENIDLSEQHLFSCAGGSCTSGLYVQSALDYMKNSGVPSESCYPYQAIDGGCSYTCTNWQSQVYKIKDWSWVSSDSTTIELALVNGPVVATFSVYEDFYGCAIGDPNCGYSRYTGGIYHHTGGLLVGGHSVSLVGYDSIQQYWIAKNSWGSGWGENGYFRIGFGEAGINNGVAAITYVKSGPGTTTMTVSYAVIGGGTPSAPKFNYVAGGISKSLTLGTTSVAVLVDSGSSWSVTSNPLDGSSSSKRWYSNQPLLGTASSSTTVTFAFYRQTWQTLSYSMSGGGSGYSPPLFQSNQFGAATPVTLTGTPTGYWFDYGSAWTVTNPLVGSGLTERWFGTKATSGTIGASTTLAFPYQHQFYLTMQVNPSGAGSTKPISSRWYNAGQTVTINAAAVPGHKFLSWAGTGTGSYTGNSKLTTIILNSAITETANFT